MKDSEIVKERFAYQVDAVYAIQSAVGIAHDFNPDDVHASISMVTDTKVVFTISNHMDIGCNETVHLKRDETVKIPEEWL